MRVNYIGIVGCVFVFVSIIFPWYTLSLSGSLVALESKTLYLYQTTYESTLLGGLDEQTEQPYQTTYLVLALMIVSGVLALVGSLTQKSTPSCIGGVFAAVSVGSFAGFMSMSLQHGIGLLSSGTISGQVYSSYLDVGFWLALVGAVLLLSSIFVTTKSKVAPYQQPSFFDPAHLIFLKM